MEENIKETFSRNLKELLYSQNKNQSDLCTYLGVSSATVSDWCNAKKMPRMEKIQLIANWLHVDLSYLMEESPAQDSSMIYYLDEDARAAAEFLHKNPDYKVLFDASRKVKKEDIEFVKKMIDKFSE